MAPTSWLWLPDKFRQGAQFSQARCTRLELSPDRRDPCWRTISIFGKTHDGLLEIRHQARRIAWFNQYRTTGVQDIGGSTPLDSDDRLSGSHCLQNHGCARIKYARQHQYIRLLQQFGATLLGLPPEELDVETRSGVEKHVLLDAVARPGDHQQS